MKADIGIIGGSGFYQLFEDGAEEVKAETPYGQPSGTITVGMIAGKKVAFLPRHGQNHDLPPHKINYRANIHALTDLGVQRILGPSACGSLQTDIPPGTFVITDQYVNWTNGRQDTFFEGPEVKHVSSAEPYCEQTRTLATEACKDLGIAHKPEGTVVIINGPRFSTKAESKFFSTQGWHTINMTQYPEAMLAKEKGLCYFNVGLVTDFDAGLEDDPSVKPVTMEDVIKVFGENIENLKRLIGRVVENLPEERACACANHVKEAVAP